MKIPIAYQEGAESRLEDFHKALKTGLGVEKLQFEKATRLFAATAMMSIVALRLVGLREQLRDHPQRLAEVALAIGRLGGHLNRRKDGPPGWITLWRGMKKLDLLVQGVRLARKLPGFG